MINVKLVFSLFCLFLILILKNSYIQNPNRNYSTSVTTSPTKPPVYCLMITGHSVDRRSFAMKSIQNFFEQSYKNKHLLIINQSKIPLLQTDYKSVLEVYVNNKNTSLGELRNISLQLVPPNAIWTTWDDDDYRDQTYVETMIHEFIEKKCDFLMFQNRLEYNLKNDFAFKLTLKSGLMTFFARSNPNLIYDHVSTSEDKVIKNYALKNLNVYLYDNNPFLYVRAIHNSNTSKYVNNDRESISDTSRNKVFFEYNLNKFEKQELNNIIYKYYK